MRILRNKLERELPIRTELNFPVEGVEFIDIMPLVMEKEIYNEIIKKFVEKVENKKIDYVISPESRGFLFGISVARELNVGFIPVRKNGKIPPNAVEKEFTYNKEYGLDRLALPKLVNDEYKDKNFYVIDDIYATGNTLKGIKQAIKELGGNIVATSIIINIVELNHDRDIYSLLDVNEE